MAECKHDWVDISTHADRGVRVYLCVACKITRDELKPPIQSILSRDNGDGFKPIAEIRQIDILGPASVEGFPHGAPFTWENLLAYLRWQSQRDEVGMTDNAYIFADFDGESIGIDGHLSRESLEAFLQRRAPNG